MGAIIGAGVLGIPYVISLSGFKVGLLHLIIIGIIMAILMLYLGEITLRTKKDHQLAGYAEKYLGKKGKILMSLAFGFGIYASLTAYIIGEGESLAYLFFNSSQHTIYAGILFWIILTAMTFFGIRALEKGEFAGVSIIAILTLWILISSWNKINIDNLSYINTSHFFTPIGVILFAFLGFAAIPELERILKKDEHLMKKTIVTSYISCFVIYLLFALAVVGLKGLETPQIATLALGKIFILLGMLTMFTSYLALSIALIDMFRFDFNVKKTYAWLHTSLVPLIFFIFLVLTNSASFTKLLSIGGLVSGGLTAILVISMIKKAKQKGDRVPEYSMPYSKIFNAILILLFIAGMALELLKSI